MVDIVQRQRDAGIILLVDVQQRNIEKAVPNPEQKSICRAARADLYPCVLRRGKEDKGLVVETLELGAKANRYVKS